MFKSLTTQIHRSLNKGKEHCEYLSFINQCQITTSDIFIYSKELEMNLSTPLSRDCKLFQLVTGSNYEEGRDHLGSLRG